jgi:hypothetical protein
VRQGFAEDRNIMFTYYFNVGVSVRLNSPVIYVKSTRDRSRENRDVRPIPGRTSTVVFAVLLTDLSNKTRPYLFMDYESDKCDSPVRFRKWLVCG